jgi:hypothetical protein
MRPPDAFAGNTLLTPLKFELEIPGFGSIQNRVSSSGFLAWLSLAPSF